MPRFGCSGGATYRFRRVPCARISLTVTWPGKNEGVSAAIGRNGPGASVVVVHFEIDGAFPVSELQAAAGFLKSFAIDERAENVCRSESNKEIGWTCHDDNESMGWKHKLLGKCKVDVAGDLPSAQLFKPGEGIINFDELEISFVGPFDRVVHHFRNDDPRPARGRAEGFGCRTEKMDAESRSFGWRGERCFSNPSKQKDSGKERTEFASMCRFHGASWDAMCPDFTDCLAERLIGNCFSSLRDQGVLLLRFYSIAGTLLLWIRRCKGFCSAGGLLGQVGRQSACP